MKQFLIKNKMNIFVGIAIIIPLLLTMSDIIRGNISFWYDPARDFIYALENLQKPTLIGPTTGIPGLFYGPYWIWLLSIGLLLSHDPRIVITLVLVIPYFTLFPYILLKFRKLYGVFPVLLVWSLFAINFGRFYSSQPWNPHLAPLLFLALISLLFFTDYQEKKKSLRNILFAGFISGLLINFHWSLGATLFLGSVIFLFIFLFFITKDKKNMFTNVFYFPLFGLGALAAFAPFLLFEVRHGFQQAKTILNVITTEGTVVGVTGLTKLQIIEEFLKVFSKLLSTPAAIGYGILFISLIIFFFSLYKKKISIDKQDIKLIALLLSYCIGILFVYLTAKNPVWNYHFIGIEIIFMFVMLLMSARVHILKMLLAAWVMVVVLYTCIIAIQSLTADPLRSSSLYTKEYITDLIVKDAGTTSYTVYAYHSSIYVYDYSYLFMMKGKNVPWDPGAIVPETDRMYIIIPSAPQKVKADFIQFRSSDILYKTVQTWQIADGTTIVKRTKK